MLITYLNRVQLLEVLPKAGTVAEIGVLRGGYSAKIQRIVEPERLHLIDPWGRTEEPNRHYPEPLMQAAYEKVQTRFSEEIEAQKIVLHRDFSTSVAPTFPDQFFDWVYVDGQHDYASAHADLMAFKQKVKPDGFILGHDFSNYRKAKRFGVVAAVRDFTKDEGFEIVVVTNETNPTYLLARSTNDTTLPALRSRLLEHEGGWPIEVDTGLLDRFEQVAVTYGDGRQGRIMKFG